MNKPVVALRNKPEKKNDEIPPLHAKEQLKSKWDDEDIDDSDVKEHGRMKMNLLHLQLME
ncbi:hypothetical protein EPI10_020803 [Gossypium australe]|uniref:Uncharacterized protein n=1 Tax=Gossypium australe TaxID=47621 RepID=A0A5B6WFC5_9ROSI|nr:hypothetical protein EPI10_020803 [Gossypium australe]